MSERKKVLILTADAGFGHRSAAIAVAAAIEEKYSEDTDVEIVNPLDDIRVPTFLRDSQTDYTKWVRHVPELYQLGYEASDSLLPTTILENSLVVLLIDAMRGILEASNPDVILTTYPLYQSTLTALFRSKRGSTSAWMVVWYPTIWWPIWPQAAACRQKRSISRGFRYTPMWFGMIDRKTKSARNWAGKPIPQQFWQ